MSTCPWLCEVAWARACNGGPGQKLTVSGTPMRAFRNGDLPIYLALGTSWDFAAVAGVQQAAQNWNAMFAEAGISARFNFPGAPLPAIRSTVQS